MTNRQRTIIDRLQFDFRYRICPAGVDPSRHYARERARSIVGIAALDLAQSVPDSRERNHALNKLDEALMWSHAAIDRCFVKTEAEAKCSSSST